MSAASLASYAWGQCTYFVAKTLGWVPAGLGNAENWLANAQKKGYKTTANPTVGSVVVYGPGGLYSSLGHVAVVTAVNPSNQTFTVEEGNFGGGPGSTDTRVSTLANVEGFILPPAGQGQGGASFTPAPAPGAGVPVLGTGILGTNAIGTAVDAFDSGVVIIGAVILVVAAVILMVFGGLRGADATKNMSVIPIPM